MIITAAHGVVLLALAFLLWKRADPTIKRYFWPAWILKLAAGAVLGWIYTYYYAGGDTWGFFRDGVTLAREARTNFSVYVRFLWSGDESFDVWSQLRLPQPRALFLSKIVSLFCLLTHDRYMAVAWYFSMLSFWSAWHLTTVVSRYWPPARAAAVLALLYWPTAVLWTSGIIKESLALASLYFLVAISLQVWARQRLSVLTVGLVAFALWMLWSLKYYYLAVFLPVACAALVMRRLLLPRMPSAGPISKVAVWIALGIVPAVLLSQLHPNFYPERFLSVITENYEAFQRLSEANDMAHFPSLEPTLASVLRHSPAALLTGLFRPWVWEAHTFFQVAVAIENIVLAVLILMSLRHLRTLPRSPHRLLVLSIVVYTVLLCVFLTLSTPNFGTLSRYRVGFLPFLVLLVCADNVWITRIFRFLQSSK
ncbi:hypothetical protein [Dawidia soli]|uniref:Uncharacterized protein n=1 Tax=Dawidia soli TaxID=2782352 RepID=A0AAP2DCU5_9BACT|nr:hypothetical protein [Dawidia soli]MBT1689669.1 hypothetical protein [Dawidia soli]